jgi:hypothetical protein
MIIDGSTFTLKRTDVSNRPLFITIPDTDFRDYLDVVASFAESHPDVVASVEADQDRLALEKKQMREADKKISATPDFPNLEVNGIPASASIPTLMTGRPRTPAFLVFILYMLRGFLGSVSDKQATRWMRESISLQSFLVDRHLRLPAETTMIENTNQIGAATQELIFKRQIEDILEEGLDDFKELTIDSTGVVANTAWPTDGKTLVGLIGRTYRIGRKLNRFGLVDFVEGHLPRWIGEMNAIEFEINLVGGKKGAQRKRRKLYGKLLKKGEKAVNALQKEVTKKARRIPVGNMLPSQIQQLDRIIGQLCSDLADARRVLDYTRKRIFEAESLPAREKILSLSDGSAAYISKGEREAIIGYKPQLTRSANGFVADLTVPEGNAADSAQFVPCIRNAIARTGVLAELVSSDDGYSSRAGKEKLEGIGVGIVSISGSKGKKITDPEEWDSEPFRKARNDRSAVESLMFTLKDGFEFGRLSRRGIDAARSELTGKVLAYNFCRKIEIRKRQAEQLRLAG